MKKKATEKFKKMAYISYNKIWESQFGNMVSKRNKLQDMKFNQLKIGLHETC